MIAFLACANVANAQLPNEKFGKPSSMEWEFNGWGDAVNADAIILCKTMKATYQISDQVDNYNKNSTDISTDNISDFGKNDIDEILTLAEAVRYDCEWLSHFFPEAQIILLSPLQTTAAPTELIHQAGDIIEECGRRMSINTIRQDYGSCVNAMHEKEVYRYTYDGTHTSVEGAKRNGYYIARQVKSMLYY